MTRGPARRVRRRAASGRKVLLYMVVRARGEACVMAATAPACSSAFLPPLGDTSAAAQLALRPPDTASRIAHDAFLRNEVRRLLALGADLTSVDNEGKTALEVAEGQGKYREEAAAEHFRALEDSDPLALFFRGHSLL